MTVERTSPAIIREVGQALSTLPGVVVRSGEPLSEHTSMGVGGPADLLVTLERVDALTPALRILDETQVPRFILGGGSNTLFTEAGFRGAVLRLSGEFRAIESGEEPDTVRGGAGAGLSAMMKFAQRQGLGGLEFAIGIPGTLGGALAGNAGAGGEDVCSLTEWVRVLSPTGALQTLRRGEFSYSYRKSELRDRFIVDATLKLHARAPEAIKAAMDRHLSKRWEQPVGERSSGCMFKNPSGSYAGQLIEKAGLKGMKVGGVRVSEQHANFMVNEGHASADDVERLMLLVKSRVKEQTGIELDSEVRVVQPFA